MATPQKKKTVALATSGLIIAILPSLFGYLQNRDEIKSKYSATQRTASSGYDALAKAVEELQKASLDQHDYIVKMEAQLEIIQGFVMRTASTRSGWGTGSGRLPAAAVIEPPSMDSPPSKPDYGALPVSIKAAQLQDPLR